MSLATFSPQPSKMQTRTGFLSLEIVPCGFNAFSMAMTKGSAHQEFSRSWSPRAYTDRGVKMYFDQIPGADRCSDANSFDDMLTQVAMVALESPSLCRQFTFSYYCTVCRAGYTAIRFRDMSEVFRGCWSLPRVSLPVPSTSCAQETQCLRCTEADRVSISAASTVKQVNRMMWIPRRA